MVFLSVDEFELFFREASGTNTLFFAAESTAAAVCLLLLHRNYQFLNLIVN